MTGGARHRRGSILVEFALLGPVLFALTMTVLEGAWQALTAATLDIGAREASRFGSTGATAPEWLPPPAPATREEAVRRVVLHFGPYLLRPDRLTLTISAYLGAGSIGQQGAGQAGAGAAGETVVYELSYEQPFLTPFPGIVLGRPSIQHRSRMIVRNEPFPAT